MKHHPYKSKYVITQTFLNPSSRYASGLHLGVDLVGLEDKNIYAIEEGKVVLSGHDADFGNTVIIKQSDGLYSRYSHLESIEVITGQNVLSGMRIGIEGQTGHVVGRNDPRHLDLRLSTVPYHTDTEELYFNPCDYLGVPNKLNHIVSPEDEELTKIENVILCKSEIDKRAAGYLADYLDCKIIDFDLLPSAVLDEIFEKVYVIGSSEKPVAKAINIYGLDRYDTCERIISMIKEARRKDFDNML